MQIITNKRILDKANEIINLALFAIRAEVYRIGQ